MSSDDVQSESEVEQELIHFLRELELDEMEPWQWGTAAHKASEKLDELADRGVIDEGGRRYDDNGNRVDPIEVKLRD